MRTSVFITKIILSLLLFLCLFKMPYGYYQFIRFASLVGFAILAYQANERQNKTEMIIYICLAILFQLLIKISLSREIWNIIDVIVGIFLIASLFIKRIEK
ncbi:MAG: hypothetical protein HGB12_16310 [Bacteroidetes bacterium]|nr:hypothetical protein [Bacteroidota bacterium]